MFNAAVYFGIGGAFNGTAGGIYRTTDFTGVTPPSDVTVAGFDKNHDNYLDINMDVDGVTCVAVGDRIDYSTNAGATWNATNVNGADAQANLVLGEGSQHGIAFSPDHVVAVGEYDNFVPPGTGAAYWAARSNLAAWNQVQVGSSFALLGVAYGQGAFIATGGGGGLWRSLDNGQTWAQIDSGTQYSIIQYANGTFMAIAQDATQPHTQAVSTDGGATWSFGTAALGVDPNRDFGQFLYYDPSLNIWVLLSNGSGANGPEIWTAPGASPLTMTLRFTGTAQSGSTGPDFLTGVVQTGAEYIAVGNYKTGLTTTEPIMVRPNDLITPTGGWTRTLPSAALVDYLAYPWGRTGSGAGILLWGAPPSTTPVTLLVSTDDMGSFAAVSGVPVGFGQAVSIAWAFQSAPPVTIGSDTILMMREVTGGRITSPFSRLNGLPSPFISLRQIFNPESTSQEDSFILLGLASNGGAYELFGGTQDGTVTATAVTQPLPTLEDVPKEVWDTQKTFRSLYVEGVDINNFKVSFSVDGGTTYPWGPYPLTQRYNMGIPGKQLTIKFVHSVASTVVPQLTYIRLDYDINAGQIQGSQ